MHDPHPRPRGRAVAARSAPGPARRASMRLRVSAWAALSGAALLSPASAQQRYDIDLGRLDPAAVLALGDDVLLRAPDPAIDRLFKAVHASSRSDAEAAALCALFEPDAPRDLRAFQRVAGQLGDASRERFALAFTDIALGGLQGQPRQYDPLHARQVLKSAAATAAFLHEGFMPGLAADGGDDASRKARCQSFRWLVGVLDGLPQPDRAAATRWLLREGLSLAVGQG